MQEPSAASFSHLSRLKDNAALMRSAPLRRTDRLGRHFRLAPGGRGSLREILRRFFSRLYRRERKSFAKRERREGAFRRVRAATKGSAPLEGRQASACTEQDTVFAQPKGGFRARRGRKC